MTPSFDSHHIRYRTASGDELPVLAVPAPSYAREELELEVHGLRLVNAAQRAELAALRAQLAHSRAELAALRARTTASVSAACAAALS